MASIGSNLTMQITSKIDLFRSIMQQNVIKNKFNNEYATLATIQLNIDIQFTVIGASDLYLNLNNSQLHMFAKITKVDENNLNVNTAAQIYLRCTRCVA